MTDQGFYYLGVPVGRILKWIWFENTRFTLGGFVYVCSISLGSLREEDNQTETFEELVHIFEKFACIETV